MIDTPAKHEFEGIKHGKDVEIVGQAHRRRLGKLEPF